MAATYFGSSINESPTVVFPAGEKLENARGIALRLNGNKVMKPAAGAHVVGISQPYSSNISLLYRIPAAFAIYGTIYVPSVGMISSASVISI